MRRLLSFAAVVIIIAGGIYLWEKAARGLFVADAKLKTTVVVEQLAPTARFTVAETTLRQDCEYTSPGCLFQKERVLLLRKATVRHFLDLEAQPILLERVPKPITGGYAYDLTVTVPPLARDEPALSTEPGDRRVYEIASSWCENRAAVMEKAEQACIAKIREAAGQTATAEVEEIARAKITAHVVGILAQANVPVSNVTVVFERLSPDQIAERKKRNGARVTAPTS
jgi:hypothetical protein